MKKNVIVFGVISVLILVVFSGCQEDSEMASVKFNFAMDHTPYIRTVRFFGWNERDILIDDSGYFQFHPDMEAYEIHGYFINQKDEEYYRVVLTANYYDIDDNLLVTQTTDFFDVRQYFHNDFLFIFNHSDHFETVDHVEMSYEILKYKKKQLFLPFFLLLLCFLFPSFHF